MITKKNLKYFNKKEYTNFTKDPYFIINKKIEDIR
jgi:hypothetical protein